MKAVLKILNYLWVLAFSVLFIAILYSNFVGPLHPVLESYVMLCQKALGIFLSSWVFGIVFVIGWVTVNFQLSRQSGWKKLAEHYEFRTHVPDRVKKLHMGSGRVGSIYYNNMIRVAVSGTEIILKVFFVFRFGHPCLCIPWEDVESINIQGSPVDKVSNPVLYAISSRLSWAKYAKIRLKKLPEQNLVIPWREEFSSNTPQKVGQHNCL